MTDTNQEQEDAVLRRMLATKPPPHKPKGDAKPGFTYVNDKPKKQV